MLFWKWLFSPKPSVSVVGRYRQILKRHSCFHKQLLMGLYLKGGLFESYGWYEHQYLLIAHILIPLHTVLASKAKLTVWL
jgi:hypothetical protein